MIPLAGLLSPARIADLRASTRDDAIAELCALLEGEPGMGDLPAFRRAVEERERELSTGIGLGIAVPHSKVPR